MKNSKYIFLAAVAVLFVFAKHSEANSLASLDESTKIEKLVTNSKFQDKLQTAIAKGTDRDSLAARATIEFIQKEAQKLPLNAVSPSAISSVIDGVLDTMRIVYGTIRKANIQLDNALNRLKVQDTEGAIDVIKNGLRADSDLIFIAGVTIHDAQGIVLSLVGGAAQPDLKKTIISIQKGGGVMFEIFKIADGIASAGIKEGGLAAEEAIEAARDILSTGLVAVQHYSMEAIQSTLNGVKTALSKTIYRGENDVIPGVIESLKTQISTDDAVALGIIVKLKSGLKSVLSVLTKKSAIDAAKIMYEGVRTTIIETADAISFARKTFEEARKLTSKDPESAIDIIHKGIKVAQDQILSASAGGYLGFGAAGQIAGKEATEKLVPAVIDLEYGRVAAYDDLKHAEEIATVGIRGGESAAALGINTALRICNAAGLALYQDYADAGAIGFEVFKKV